jgi:serine/threonine-protein kinase
MKADRAALLDVIESVADGANLDWDALESGLKDEQDRRLFAQLKILARIAEVHRSQSDDPEDHVVPARTLGAKVIGQIRPQRPVDTQRVDEDAPVFEAPAMLADELRRPEGQGAGSAQAQVMPALGPTMGLPDAALPEFPPVDVARPGSLQHESPLSDAAPNARPSRIWGHLELLARIGEGTFGEVYRARDTKLQREVAVKLLRVGGGPEDRQTETVLREARILARVSHPNVVLVHGAETVDDRVGLWMELIRGATLEQLIQSHGPYSAREATVIGQDLCRALAAVHGAGLVHRDVKAQNVMREEGGRLVLMDFGAGQLLGGPSPGLTGRITGTPLYLAPEVLAGGEATTRSDIYSLGVLLYHLVTASYPLRARSVEELREAHRTGKRIRLHDARPDLQDNLVEVIERSLAPNPSDRFSSAGEMQSALTLALGVGVAGATVQTRDLQPFIGAPLAPSRAGAGARPGWMLVAAVCAFALVGGATAAWFVKSSGWSPFAAAPSSLTRQTIAVLPIQSATGKADPIFVEVQDSLISALGHISSLRAISRTSVMRYADGGKLMPEIGRELHAEYIIESTAARDGDRVRMTSRLVRAGDDTQLWAATIERPLTEVLKMGGVALDIAGMLGAKTSLNERNGLVAEHTPESPAQTAYLEGRYQMGRESVDGYRAARPLLEQAVSLDPRYARAYASLAHCYLVLQVYGVLSRDDASRLALEAAKRAVLLDDSLADGHVRLANVLFELELDWSGAEKEYQRAIASNASDPAARASYARFLAAKGELQEARRQVEIAQESAPLSADALGALGNVLYYNRDFDKAEAAFKRSLEFAPQSAAKYTGLGRVLSAKGDCPGAIRALEQAVRLTQAAPAAQAELARTYAGCGQSDTARRLLAELERPSSPVSAGISPQHRAYVYAALGDKDRAFSLLGEAVSRHETNIAWAKVDPRLDALRADARYGTLLRGLGLAE